MEFVNPGFLYGLLAMSVPVIIHLFNFRRFRKVYFTNVAFIKELKQQTQKQSRLKHLLVLLMRMLAIAAIVLAFARPYIPAGNAIINPESLNNVSIYVDNSFSMQAESDEGTLLDAAKNKAAEIVSVYGNADRFHLLTNDLGGQQRRFLSQDEFLEALDDITIKPATRTYSEILEQQDQMLSEQNNGNKAAYILSDFQESMMKQALPDLDTLTDFFMVPLQAINSDNLYIDSCWFESPVQQVNQASILHIRFRNSSSGDYEKVPVKLMVNDQQKSLTSLDMKAREDAEVTLNFTSKEQGIHYGQVQVTDYPITFDDNLYFSFPVSEEVRILSINGDGPNPFLNAMFDNDTSFYYVNVPERMLDYSSLNNYNLIILNQLKMISSGMRQEIKRFVESGGNLAVFPSAGMDILSYNDMLKGMGAGQYAALDTMDMDIRRISLEHPLYAGVFEEIPENINLPHVLQHYPVRIDSRQIQEKLLELDNDDIFLNVQPAGDGRVYLFAVPIDPSFSNFPRHALFVPTLYNIAISSVSAPPLYYTLGRDEMIRVNNLEVGNDEVLRIKAVTGDFEFIPEQRKINSGLEIFPRGQIALAGFYHLVYNNKVVRGLAYNYDHLESNMAFMDADALEEYLQQANLPHMRILSQGKQPFVQALTELSQGKQLWRWFIWSALLFFLIETLLLRFWK